MLSRFQGTSAALLLFTLFAASWCQTETCLGQAIGDISDAVQPDPVDAEPEEPSAWRDQRIVGVDAP